MNLDDTTDIVPEMKEEIISGTTFKNNLEVENFYRFIYDNDLRRESKMILDRIFSGIHSVKKKRKVRNPKKMH